MATPFSPQSELQVQAYYDLTERYSPTGDGAFVLRTYDLQMQQSEPWVHRHRLVWGPVSASNDYDITSTATLLFVPEARALTLGNVFAQDTIALSRSLSATVGLKWKTTRTRDGRRCRMPGLPGHSTMPTSCGRLARARFGLHPV